MRQVTEYGLQNGRTEYYTYYPYNAANIGESGAVNTYTDAEGNLTTYTYYASGKVHIVTNARGVTTTYEYDWRGKVKKVYPDTTFIGLTQLQNL